MATSAENQGVPAPGISDDELDARVARVRAELDARGLKGLIAYSAHRDYQPGDLRYLARFYCKEEESACLYIPVQGQTTLITNASWDLRRAEREAHADQAVHVPEFADALKDLLRRTWAAGDKIGISGWSFFPAPTYVGLTAAFPDVTFSDETDILTRLRAVKSEAELALIRAACRVTDRAMRAALEATHEGVTEVEIAAAADAVIRTSGAEPSFIYEVGSGTRTATGISVPTDRRIARGELVMIDVGGMFDGYHGDMARTLVIGGPTEVQPGCSRPSVARTPPPWRRSGPGSRSENSMRGGGRGDEHGTGATTGRVTSCRTAWGPRSMSLLKGPSTSTWSSEPAWCWRSSPWWWSRAWEGRLPST